SSHLLICSSLIISCIHTSHVSQLSLFVFSLLIIFFFFNDTATTEIYTLSLHDALPIWEGRGAAAFRVRGSGGRHEAGAGPGPASDRKSTRLNSSHVAISYAVFCLKKKKKKKRY